MPSANTAYKLVEESMKKDSEFYFFMEAGAELAEDLSDGAWWAFLEDHVKFWNQDHGTNYDPTDMVHRFLELRNDRKEKP